MENLRKCSHRWLGDWRIQHGRFGAGRGEERSNSSLTLHLLQTCGSAASAVEILSQNDVVNDPKSGTNPLYRRDAKTMSLGMYILLPSGLVVDV